MSSDARVDDETFDAIVIGAGGVGTAALSALARRGARCLGIDRFPPGHDRGSSHGETRLIRLAYFEHPDYVPLLRESYRLWAELEARVEETLYRETGLLEIGPPDGVVVRGVLQSAADHGLEVERLGDADLRARYPTLRLPPGAVALHERRAGLLFVERSVCAFARDAERAGARLAIGETVRSWRREGETFRVDTDRSSYCAPRVIVTAGAWAGELLADLGVALEVRRQSLFWFRADGRHHADRGFPAFFFELADGAFYGFPSLDDRGVKVAKHSSGERVLRPLETDRSVHTTDEQEVFAFLTRHLPDVSQTRTHHAVCLYTMSPDAHFIVDRHPDAPGLVFAAGLSGHGYKFAPVLGETLADLALEGRTARPIEFLGLDRPALRR